MRGTETLPRCRWHHQGRRYLFGWLVAGTPGGADDCAVIDVRGRVHRVHPEKVSTAA